MPIYTYTVTSHNGAGVYSEHQTLKEAMTAAVKTIARRQTLSPLEITRVEHVGYGKRFSSRQKRRWVPWDPHRDIDVRQPDYLWSPALNELINADV